jgi:hypothetical protein
MKMAVLALACERVRTQARQVSPSDEAAPPVLPVVPYQQPYLCKSLTPWVDTDTVGVDIYLFEPGTLIPYNLGPFFQPSIILRHMSIPDVPDYINWTTRQWSVVTQIPLPDLITDPKFKKAARFAKTVWGKEFDAEAILDCVMVMNDKVCGFPVSWRFSYIGRCKVSSAMFVANRYIFLITLIKL